MSQTSYSLEPGVAIAGMYSGIGPKRVRSLTNNEGTDVPFGVAVTENSEGKFDLIDAAADVLAGFVMHEHLEATSTTGSSGIPNLKPASILEQGQIWAVSEETMAVGDDVFVRHTANGAGKLQLGAVRNDVDGGNARQIFGARVITGCTGAGVVCIEIDALTDSASLEAIASAADAALRTDLATVNDAAKGAALVGVRDAGTIYTGATVEACLAEVKLIANANAVAVADLGFVAATPGSEGTNAIEVACGIQDVSGDPIAEARQVVIETLAVTADKGDISAADTPVGTLHKAVNPATGPNVAAMTSTSGGLFSFKVTNDVAEITTVRITADGCRPKLLNLTFA